MTKPKPVANPPEVFAPYPVPQPPPYPMQQPAFGYGDRDPKLDPWQQSSVTLLQDRNATVAKVSVNQCSKYFNPPDFEFRATGSSKREQGDRFNARTGELLALSRAYLNLSRQLYAAGKELIEPEPSDAEFEGAMAAMDEIINAAEPEGIEVFDENENIVVLEDPTDEDVELAKEILGARAAYNAAVAESQDNPPAQMLINAIGAFNEAAEALNSVRAVLGEFVE